MCIFPPFIGDPIPDARWQHPHIMSVEHPLTPRQYALCHPPYIPSNLVDRFTHPTISGPSSLPRPSSLECSQRYRSTTTITRIGRIWIWLPWIRSSKIKKEARLSASQSTLKATAQMTGCSTRSKQNSRGSTHLQTPTVFSDLVCARRLIVRIIFEHSHLCAELTIGPFLWG